ncbi:MAG: four helix bundle protein [bacterium]
MKEERGKRILSGGDVMQKAHKKLKAWQEAIELHERIYTITAKLPQDEKFGLAQQMKRAAVSIPSNIAEGASHQGNKDSIQFYIIARSSLSELDTQIEICKKIHFITEEHFLEIETQMDKVDSLLSGLIRFKRNANS